MPTRAGWSVLVGAGGAVVAGRLFGTVELYVLGAIAATLVVLAVAWVRRRLPTVEIVRRIRPQHIVAGAFARVDLEVRNGERRCGVVAVVDPVEGTVGARTVLGPIAPHASEQVGYRLPTRRRGRIELGPVVLDVTDPFGLARRARSIGSPTVVTVLPAMEEVPAPPAGGGRHQPLTGHSRRSLAAAGAEDLATLRPYQLGDDLRRVHWPSSARTDDLQVRRDEEQWQGHLTVVVDAAADAMGPEAFERAVSLAAGFVHAAAEAGDQVRLVVGPDDSGMVDAHRAQGALLERLALVGQHPEPNAVPVATDLRSASALVVIVGPSSAARHSAVGAGPPPGFDSANAIVLIDAANAAGPATGAGGSDGPARTAELHLGTRDRLVDRWPSQRGVPSTLGGRR